MDEIPTVNKRCRRWEDERLYEDFTFGEPRRCLKVRDHKGKCSFNNPKKDVFTRTPGYTDDGAPIVQRSQKLERPFAHWAWKF